MFNENNLIESLLTSDKMPLIQESEMNSYRVILENQEKECEKLMMSEGSVSADIQQFIPIFMPLARRVMPKLIANELVGIQPMSMPTGYLFSIAFRYTGDGVNSASPVNNSTIIEVTPDEADKLKAEIGKNIKFDTKDDIPVLYVEGKYVLVGAKDITTDMTPGAATTNTVANVPAAVLGVYSSELAFQKIFKNYTGPHTTAQGEGLATDMKEIGFSIEKKAIEAKTRKLKARYTIELYQDLKAIHGLNADEELMNIMGQEVEQELNREIIEFVNGLATITTDFKIDSIPGRYEIEKFAHLSARIDQEALEIARWCRRGAGNVIIASPKVVSLLKALNGYKPIETKADIKIEANPAVVGTLDGRKVIMDSFAKEDYVTILYKGANKADAAAFYAPYTPVSFTKVTHQESGQPAVVLMSRYGIAANPVSPETYVRSFKVNFQDVKCLS